MHTLITALHALTARQFTVGMMAYGRTESLTLMLVAILADLARGVLGNAA